MLILWYPTYKEPDEKADEKEKVDHKKALTEHITWININRKNAIILLMIIGLFFFILYSIYFMVMTNNNIKSVKEDLLKQNETLTLQLKEVKRKHNNLQIQFDTYKKMTNDEFIRTWQSFRIIRNNFLALGTGFHLSKDDIYPGTETGIIQ